MMNMSVYKLECLTNMHVGDGEANYNIVDNEVQKDIVLEVPTIHSSSVKGAFRSFAVEQKMEANKLNKIFGIGGKQTEKGEYKFFSGNMLARPVRVSEGNTAYVLATSPDIVLAEIELLESIGFELKISDVEKKNLNAVNKIIAVKTLENGKNNTFIKEIEGEKIEEYVEPEGFEVVTKLLGDKWVMVPHDKLKMYGLPVQARNHLEAGISTNLWYEEVVPYKSIFYVVVLMREEDELYRFIEEKGGIVQFGANATIGYGYCKVTKL